MRTGIGILLAIAITFGAYEAGFHFGVRRTRQHMFVRCLDANQNPFACLDYVENL